MSDALALPGVPSLKSTMPRLAGTGSFYGRWLAAESGPRRGKTLSAPHPAGRQLAISAIGQWFPAGCHRRRVPALVFGAACRGARVVREGVHMTGRRCYVGRRAARLERLGVGVALPKANGESLAQALPTLMDGGAECWLGDARRQWAPAHTQHRSAERTLALLDSIVVRTAE